MIKVENEKSSKVSAKEDQIKINLRYLCQRNFLVSRFSQFPVEFKKLEASIREYPSLRVKGSEWSLFIRFASKEVGASSSLTLAKEVIGIAPLDQDKGHFFNDLSYLEKISCPQKWDKGEVLGLAKIIEKHEVIFWEVIKENVKIEMLTQISFNPYNWEYEGEKGAFVVSNFFIF